MALPRFAVLQSCHTDKYGRVEDNGELCGYIYFNGDTFLSPFAKIEFVRSKSQDCYYIRSCYNNKYWTRKSISETKVAAEAAETGATEEEEKNKEGATVFKARFVDEAKTMVHLWDVTHGGLLCVNCEHGTHLIFGDSYLSDHPRSRFKITDLDSYFILPPHVAFKGDIGKYLYAWFDNNWKKEFNQFYGDAHDSVATHYQVFPNLDGTVRIKSKRYEKFFWKSGKEWVFADASEADTYNPQWKTDCLFWPVRVGADTVALRGVGNNKFCGRWPKSGDKDDCLSASEDTISATSTLQVKDLVSSTEIYDVNFDVNNVRIYDKKINYKKITVSRENEECDGVSNTFLFTYRETTSRKWSATVSFKSSSKAAFTAGIPSLEKESSRLKVSGAIHGDFTWGQAHKDYKETTLHQNVIVPPKTRLIADLVITKLAFDVPFSYTQRDTLYDGTIVVTNMNDGLFTGVNIVNVQVVTKEEPLGI